MRKIPGSVFGELEGKDLELKGEDTLPFSFTTENLYLRTPSRVSTGDFSTFRPASQGRRTSVKCRCRRGPESRHRPTRTSRPADRLFPPRTRPSLSPGRVVTNPSPPV